MSTKGKYAKRGMNVKRAQWAGEAIAKFASITGQDIRTPEQQTEVIGDLIANLRHYCQQSGADFNKAWTQAVNHFHAEYSNPNA